MVSFHGMQQNWWCPLPCWYDWFLFIKRMPYFPYSVVVCTLLLLLFYSSQECTIVVQQNGLALGCYGIEIQNWFSIAAIEANIAAFHMLQKHNRIWTLLSRTFYKKLPVLNFISSHFTRLFFLHLFQVHSLLILSNLLFPFSINFTIIFHFLLHYYVLFALRLIGVMCVSCD